MLQGIYQTELPSSPMHDTDAGKVTLVKSHQVATLAGQSAPNCLSSSNFINPIKFVVHSNIGTSTTDEQFFDTSAF